MGIEKAMVVGAGTMGAGIAQIFAQNEIPVVLTDLSEEMVVKALGGLEARVAKRVEQGKMSAEDKDAIFSRITPGDGLFEGGGCGHRRRGGFRGHGY